MMDRLIFVVLMALMSSCAVLSEDGRVAEAASGGSDAVSAMERARQGEPDELLRLTKALAGQPELLPPRKLLAQYHKYLQDENVFIQYYAVQVVAGLKDKSSAGPLRQFIAGTERRRKDMDAAGRQEPVGNRKKEELALVLASQIAIMALGGIDEGSSLNVKVLAAQLKHDIPMEWGGGVAHKALAGKGREGLRALLDEAAGPVDDTQERFLVAAINKIRDPALAVDLYACSRDTKYNEAARRAALWALGEMAGQSPEIEQMIISIAGDENADLRPAAIGRLGVIGSDRTRSKLLELEKTLPQEAHAVQAALFACDTTNRLPGMIESLLATNTPPAEKERLFSILQTKGSELVPYADRLLAVCDGRGVPLNDLRVRVWKRLLEVTKKRYPLELDAANEQRFQRTMEEITYGFEHELYQQDAGKWKYTDVQRKQMAREETMKIVTKWGGSNKESR